MFKLFLKLTFLMIIFVSFNKGFSQDPPPSDGESIIFQDTLLDHLVGIWELTGVVAGDSVEITFEAKWVLNHQFLQLHYQDVNVPSEYEAFVYVGFNHQESLYVVHWLDVFGGHYSETLGYGKSDNNSINFVFNYPDWQLLNTFTWLPDQQKWLSVIEQQNQNGKWHTFAVQEIQKLNQTER